MSVEPNQPRDQSDQRHAFHEGTHTFPRFRTDHSSEPNIQDCCGTLAATKRIRAKQTFSRAPTSCRKKEAQALQST